MGLLGKGDWPAVTFRCCDTEWVVAAAGESAPSDLLVAQSEALRLESILNSFDPKSAVAELNRTGTVVDATVAEVARLGLDMKARTHGVFDIAQGNLEQRIKAFIGQRGAKPAPVTEENVVRIQGDKVVANGPVDLNGIAKGWMADQVAQKLHEHGVRGFVNAGGDIARPQGLVHIDGPYGGTIATLQTTWNVATSGTSRRRRDEVTHLYDPRTGQIGAPHDQVTVLSRTSCAEADALGTVLSVLPTWEALALAESWPGVEALFVRNGYTWWTRGFEAHVAAS